jgi:ABC-type polysaccharide/polyol phosphate transport system ATPase subunit
MSDVVIKAENLSKSYIIGHQAENGRYVALRDVLMQNARGLWHKTKDLVQGKPIILGDTLEEVWALKDVSFEIRRGQAVGIIGRNGAGKSTLLKILSRITEPSRGRATIKGRVASLLEVGTGFHPELTGRENIYLNGAILGMTRAEIKRKFDEIVAFAEVEKFLDTPVKRYSSGMYVRLAFAVAAHLEPEILVVDEVLAVGDAAFQRKCLGKMGEVAHEGRTVLFVSHNLAALSNVCTCAMLLDKGVMVSNGNTREVVSMYLRRQHIEQSGDIDLTASQTAARKNSLPNSSFKWTRAQVINSHGDLTTTIGLVEPFELILTGYLDKAAADLVVGFGVMSEFGFPLFNSHSVDARLAQVFNKGQIRFRVKFDPNYLAPGAYVIDLGANGSGIVDWIPEAIHLNIERATPQGHTLLRSNYTGAILHPCYWEISS